MPHLFIFGYGYTASFVAKAALAKGWQVSATTRDPAKAESLRLQGVQSVILADGAAPDLTHVTHVLSSVPPTADGDPILLAFGGSIKAARHVTWLGYLSTTGVYGDHQGAWVDETTPCAPASPRSQWRVAAEQAWQALPLSALIFRLAGIYGPGRNVIEDLLRGTARRIDKPGHVFNRIHVEDIAQGLMASMARPDPGAIYNLADDEPASSRAVVEYAAKLLGIAPPPLEDYATANLSPMARSFYEDCKRVRNVKVKKLIAQQLYFPTYREGLRHSSQTIAATKPR
jgi:nucleoside-diphosphate-sugar epimerase